MPYASISCLVLDAELLLDRDLDRQAVAVPAALALDVVAAHRLVAREDVLEDAREHVVGARACRWRSAAPRRRPTARRPRGGAPTRAKTSRSRQRASTCSSSSGKDCCGSTGRRAIWRRIVGAQPAVLPARCNLVTMRTALIALLALAATPAAAARGAWSAPRSVTASRARPRARGGARRARRGRGRLRPPPRRRRSRRAASGHRRPARHAGDRSTATPRHGLDSPTLTYQRP